MKNINHKKEFSIFGEKGFTLVETLVAVAIFASSITALMSISARGINDNVFVKNKLIASYLAAEGVELVRNMRDNAALSLNSGYWENEFLGTGSGISNVNACYSSGIVGSSANSCYIDVSIPGNHTANPCEEGECPALLYDEENGVYGYSFGQSTNFVRTINVNAVQGNSTKEVIIDSSVSWRQGNRTFTTSYQYNLFDWIGPQ